MKEFFPDVPMVALTASATRVVASDIVENLQLDEPAIIKKTFKRENLSYQVFETEDKNYELEKLLKENTGSAIVYVRSRKATIETSGFLNKKGISADFFHGGISNNDKDKKLAAWLNNQTRVMVATNAFGMGIDKADVQTIVHLNFPESLESYYQEAGRAGRNGDKAYAVILKSGHDEGRLKNQFVKTLPDVSFIKLLYNKLNNYFQISYGEGVQETFPLNFNHFCQTYDLPAMLTYNGLRVLDRYSVIALNETYYKKTNIQFTTTNNQLFYYMDQHLSVENIVQSILRTYGSVFDMPTTINTLLIAKKSKTFEQKVLDVLQQLQKDEIIDYEATDTDTLITFLTPREDDKTINVIAKPIEQQNELKIKRVEAVIDYTNNYTVCKSIQLLRYFDEEEKESCGICSVCAKDENDISGDVLSIIKEEIIKSLKKQCMTSRELVENITFKEPYILDALKDLLDDEILSINSKNQYCIN